MRSSLSIRPYLVLALLSLCAALTALPISGCAPVSLAIKESPACAALGTSAQVLEEDAQLIAELSVQLPQGQLTLALTSFINAKGLDQFNCAEQIAEALLGHPVAPLDAGTAVAANGAPSPADAQSGVTSTSALALRSALLRNKAATPGALERLQAFTAQLPPARR